jgi:1-acyl-sn-glycerol-3-phosphate acyltransferase
MTNLLLKILNFRNIKINNAELFKLIKKTDKKVVIIANHKSIFDVFVLLYGLQDIGFMLSKNGGNMLPLINQIKKRSNSFFL